MSDTTYPTQSDDQSQIDLDSWRGVAAENTDAIDKDGAQFLKGRSKALLADLIRPYKKYVWLLVFAVVLENIARLSIPKLIQHGLDEGILPLIAHQGARVLLTVIGCMLIAITVQTISRIFFLRFAGFYGQKMMLELRRRVFKKFQTLDVAFHDEYTSGRVVSRMTSDMDAVKELVSGGLDSLITAILTLIGVGILLVTLDWRLGLICLLSFPAMLLLLAWFSKASTRVFRHVRAKSALVIMQFSETMSGMRAVQSYRREPRNQQIFQEVSHNYEDATVGVSRLMAIFMPGVRLIGSITVGMVLIIGGLFVMEGQMTLGVLTAFLLYLRMFFEPMGEISEFYSTFQSAISALEKLSGVLEEAPSVVEPADPTPLATVAGAIDFNHVGFSYVSDRVVLPDLDLHIRAGQTVALVGTTGAGKTTIAKLVARFYDPTSGEVCLDGVNLRQLSDDDLRRAVTMVTQENFMFDGSVADNIAFGKPGASAAEIQAAAHAVGADTFIEAMPQGYATDVGKRGSRLSAGQRQLLSFARVFLADPAVVILDEATSSLDIPSERLVQQALQTVLAGRTAIIIAHRLSTVEIADRVLVLEHGRVVEDGAPALLLNTQDGRYAALHQAWVESLA
ncbi:MAG: ABC transporter ATP-binding protein [Propionibacteriaceae bacterium]